MCAVLKPSILRSLKPETVQSFKWQMLIEELKERAPTLHSVLASCAHKKVRTDGRRKYGVKDEAVVGVCASVLLRHKNCNMNLFQRIMSCILYSNHAGKMVCCLKYSHIDGITLLIGLSTISESIDVPFSLSYTEVC